MFPAASAALKNGRIRRAPSRHLATCPPAATSWRAAAGDGARDVGRALARRYIRLLRATAAARAQVRARARASERSIRGQRARGAMAAEAMRAALADFTPDWAEVVALVKQHGEEVVAVRAGADEDTPLHSAAYWGATEAVGMLLWSVAGV
jgi:hypothetical protein